MCWSIRLLALGCLFFPPAWGQQPVRSKDRVRPERSVIVLLERGPSLDPLRGAILARRPATEVDRIVAALEAETRRLQAPVRREIRRLGGRVTAQWWIVPGLAARVPADVVPRLAALPGVEAIHPDRVWRARLTVATNAAHHASDQANQRVVQGVKVRGRRVSVALLDTGVDADMGGSGRPHRSYFPGGDPRNRTGGGLGGSLLKALFVTSKKGTQLLKPEDAHGHGTFVSGAVAANKWHADSRIDDGVAPDAWLVSVKMADDTGAAFSSWIVSAWQIVASQRARHRIVAANNSFSGSPRLDDPVQRALDSVARNADVLVTVSAGNQGANTANSQHAFNGLAVGSIDKGSKLVSGFSARGPLAGTQRTYPDIAAVGKDLYSTLRDREDAFSQASGTSFAAPLVAGAAALVRQADPKLTALETRAILLNSTDPRADRNAYGAGILRCDRAVDAAIRHDVQTLRLTNPARLRLVKFPALKGQTRTVTLTWMRDPASQPKTADNLDLRVLDPAGRPLVASRSPQTPWERVTFTAPSDGLYAAEVRWAGNVVGARTVTFALAGVGKACIGRSTLTGISPGQTASAAPAAITLTGTNLETAIKVSVGGLAVTDFTVLSATQIRFTPPAPAPIGIVPVTVTTACGVTNALALRVSGTHPARLSGPVTVQRGTRATYSALGDRNWSVLLLLSTSPLPSRAPGIVDLRIGAGFTRLWTVGAMTCDFRGRAALTLPFPSHLASAPLWFQAIHYDARNLSVPLESTNVVFTIVP